jgi:predicted Zn-dependent protease
MDKWEQAVGEYQGILKYNPKHYEARLSIARVQMSHLNSVDAARELFEQCLAQRPDDVGAILGLAECERRLSEPDAAESRLRSLEQRELSDDQKSGVWMQLGQILMERRQLPEAIDLLNRVVATEPHNSTAMYTLGLAYASDGKQAEAEKMFQSSKRLDEQFTRLTDITIILASQPNQPDLRWEAGQILMDQGLHREGADWMATALMFDPNHLKTHRSLAQYYAEIVHDPQLAAKHQGKVRELSPADEPTPSPATETAPPADLPGSQPGKSASS